MLGVDEGAGAALALGLGHHLEGEGGLARAFRAVDLDDAAARQAADAKRDIEAEGAGGHHLGLHGLLALAEPHDRALAEGPLDLPEGGVQSLVPIYHIPIDETQIGLRHVLLLPSSPTHAGRQQHMMYTVRSGLQAKCSRSGPGTL